MAKILFVLALGLALAAAQDYSATNYNAGDSGRSETVAPDGSVQGQYSYTDPNGKLITVKYRAGKDGFHVEGDHLPKAPSAHPQQQQQPSAPQHPQIPAVPRHTDPLVTSYNPFKNPHVPDHLYQQAPQAPAPTHAPAPQYNHHQQAPQNNNGYNPFHNPHVPAHLYQQAPQAPAPAPQYNHHQAPQYNHPAPQGRAPQIPDIPRHTDPAVLNYNPFENKDVANYNPFVNPNVPSHLYQNAPNSHNQGQYQQPAPAPQHHQQNQFPGAFGPAGSNPFGFSHPNSLPGGPYKG